MLSSRRDVLLLRFCGPSERKLGQALRMGSGR